MPRFDHQPSERPTTQSMPLLPGVVIDYSVKVRGRRSLNAKRSCSQWYGEITADHPMPLQEALKFAIDHVLPQTGQVQAPLVISATVKVRTTERRRVPVQ
jgi:hypothetical protein